MNDIVRTKKLCKRYKETIALDNVSLHIPQGAIYGLIGNNGAGKTTFFNCLNEDLKCDKGEFYLSDSKTNKKIDCLNKLNK